MWKRALALLQIGGVFCLSTVRPADAQILTAQQPLVITHVSIVDVAESRLLPDMTIVIRGDRITGIENSAGFKVPPKARLINARGKFVVPGLWDMHVHLSYATESALPLLLANGVTGVRDMGSTLGQIDKWRAEVGVGARSGPRIVRVGPILNGQSFNEYQMVVGNPDEARGVVRALTKIGVDFIKIHRRVPHDSYFALMDEAKKQGIRVVGHVPLTVTTAEASDAGLASIEHTETLFEAVVTNGELLDLNGASIHKYLADHGSALFAKFVANHTVFTPTLSPWKAEISVRDGSRPDPNFRYVPASQRKIPIQPMTVSLKEVFGGFCDAVRQMHTAGVILMAGTDVSVYPRIPGFMLHDELETLVQCGLTPADALRAATLVPAIFLGKQTDFGGIQAGRLADILVLDENPLQDIRNTRKLRDVIMGGKLLQRMDLDRLLREAEQRAGCADGYCPARKLSHDRNLRSLDMRNYFYG
jgi:imidazolonepropionase-like amidohydrolase